MGDVNNAFELSDLVQPSVMPQESNNLQSIIEERLKSYEERYKAFIHIPNRRPIDSYYKTLQSDIIDEMMKSCMALPKCENCGGISPKFRKDGYSKIFQRPLPKKALKPMKELKLEIKVIESIV